MLRIENLHKRFGEMTVLCDINMEVRRGSIRGILGPNGMGKTTLLNCLVGIIRPDGGRVLWGEQDMLADVSLKQSLGYVGEFPGYYPGFAVQDLVQFFRMTYPSWSEERHRELRSFMNLPDEKKFRHLSKGMKSQLAILLNLSIMPELLIVDEPTSGLDPVVRQTILNAIVDQVAACDTTVLVAGHNTHELERICDQVAFMRDGEIVLDEPLDDLRRDIVKVQVAFENGLPAAIAEAPGLISAEKLGKVHTLVLRQDLLASLEEHDTRYLETLDISLDEIYIHYMGGDIS